MSTEHWKPVAGYEGLYEVSDHGQIRSLHQITRRPPDGLLKQKIDRQGRLRVCLARRGTKKDAQVHQLMLAAFVGPCPPGQESAHNDGNCRNNNLSNLRYDTHWNNMQDKRRHGTNFQPKGERHHLRKLTAAQVLDIFQSPLPQASLADKFCVTQTTVSNIKTGRTWAHTTNAKQRSSP